mgnify:CR=1 FL=1
MALGFLFMGAGTLTFGTSPEAGKACWGAVQGLARCARCARWHQQRHRDLACQQQGCLCSCPSRSPTNRGSSGFCLPFVVPAVAALVISLFPRMPASTLDHRCHLQVCGRAAEGGWGCAAQCAVRVLAEPSRCHHRQRCRRRRRCCRCAFALAAALFGRVPYNSSELFPSVRVLLLEHWQAFRHLYVPVSTCHLPFCCFPLQLAGVPPLVRAGGAATQRGRHRCGRQAGDSFPSATPHGAAPQHPLPRRCAAQQGTRTMHLTCRILPSSRLPSPLTCPPFLPSLAGRLRAAASDADAAGRPTHAHRRRHAGLGAAPGGEPEQGRGARGGEEEARRGFFFEGGGAWHCRRGRGRGEQQGRRPLHALCPAVTVPPASPAPQGAGDVLSELAAERAAAAAAAEGREALPYDAAGDFSPTYAGRGGGVSFERVAPCLLPEKEQVRLAHGVAVEERGRARLTMTLPSCRELHCGCTDTDWPQSSLFPYPRCACCRSPPCV